MCSKPSSLSQNCPWKSAHRSTFFTFCTATLSVTLATCARQDPTQTVDIVFSITNVEWATLPLCSTTVMSTPAVHNPFVPADCSSLQNSGRQSAILGRRTSSLEQSSKRNRNCENSALLTRISKLTYSARTWTSQPLTHLRMWSRTEYWHCINLLLLSPVFWVLFLCVSAIWSTISSRTGTSRISLWPYNW